MNVTVTVSGSSRVGSAAFAKAVKKATYAVASAFQRDLVAELETGSGKEGQPPAPWRGDLANSVELHPDPCLITVTAPYSLTQEEGTDPKHFYPFFDGNKNLTLLGQWARDRGLLPYITVAEQTRNTSPHLQQEWARNQKEVSTLKRDIQRAQARKDEVGVRECRSKLAALGSRRAGYEMRPITLRELHAGGAETLKGTGRKRKVLAERAALDKEQFPMQGKRGLWVTSPHPYVKPMLDLYNGGKAREIFQREFTKNIKSGQLKGADVPTLKRGVL